MRQSTLFTAALAALAAAGLATSAMAQKDLADGYEGIARDNFAAWSYASGAINKSGQLRTTSVQAIYNSPAPFGGNPTPVAYSLHDVTFDCTAKTAAFSAGSNYAAGGKLIGPGEASAAQAWTVFTSGFQELAASVCAM